MSVANWGAGVARGRTGNVSVERARLSQQIEQLSRASDEYFAASYVELVACLERQMRKEEAVMESINSRALRSHQEQNARVLAALHQVEPRVEQGNLTLGREALALLHRWLPAHRAAMDLALLASRSATGRHRPLAMRALDAHQGGAGRPSRPDSDTFATA
jgi:hemerythrin